MAVLSIKNAGRRCRKMGRLIPLALEYKLDNVCNAEKVPRYRRCSCNPRGIRTKINYKESITPYIVRVNIFQAIYSD